LAVAFGCSSTEPALADFGHGDASAQPWSGSGGGGGGGLSEAGDVFGDTGVPPGAGVGQACSATVLCRVGLACAAATCAPGHTLPQGSLCVTSAECQSGLYCPPTRQCAPAGTGTLGTTCTSDAQCTSDLKCAIVGMYPVCTTPGQGDLGATCTSSLDCLGNLACAAGSCQFTPPGLPFGVPTWAGETCETETGNPIAWFSVPRASGNKDFYRLPFPNDIRLRKETADSGLLPVHPDLESHPVPGPGLVGFDIVDRTLRAIETDNDGWSAYPTVYFRFNAWPDFSSFAITDDAGHVEDYRLHWYDLQTGDDNGRSWSASPERGRYICGNWLAVRPSQGAPLTPGHTYAVTMEELVTTSDGTPFGATSDFQAMVGPSQPTDPVLATAWAWYAPLRAFLATHQKRLINAAVFTVGKVRDRAVHVSSAVAAATLPPVTWTSCAAGADAGSDAGAGCACGVADPAFEELHAVIPMPIFQKGTPPYLDPKDGGDIPAFGVVPGVSRTENVCAALTIPKGKAMPAGGWPLVVYAHGTGGDFRSHITEGVAALLAGAKDAPTDGMAVLGIDQVQNGARRGGSTLSANTLFYNFRNPKAMRDNVLQGAADQLFLARVAAAGLDAGTGKKTAGAKVFFWGHSQGATEGSVAGPLANAFGAVVLSGQGASLLDSLVTKTQPENIAGALPIALLDPDTNGSLWWGGLNPVLSLVQTLGDPSDPLNFASGMASSPIIGGVTAHHVFQVYGQNDSYSPDVTEATYALAAGLAVATHDTSVTTPAPIGGTPETATPLSGNISSSITAAMREYAPAAGKDGHFVAFDNATAREDIARFLAQAAAGKVPQVGKVLIVDAGPSDATGN
jgi:hypothetical protein